MIADVLTKAKSAKGFHAMVTQIMIGNRAKASALGFKEGRSRKTKKRSKSNKYPTTRVRCEKRDAETRSKYSHVREG